MNDELSPNARAILEAAVKAAKAEGTPDVFSAADKAVEHEVGRIALADPAHGGVRIVRSLTEIAQLYVRHLLSKELHVG